MGQAAPTVGLTTAVPSSDRGYHFVRIAFARAPVTAGTGEHWGKREGEGGEDVVGGMEAGGEEMKHKCGADVYQGIVAPTQVWLRVSKRATHQFDACGCTPHGCF